MPKYEGNDEDDDYRFERFRKRPKNTPKGKHNRSNEKQSLKDYCLGNQDSEDFYDDRWDEQ